MDISQEAKNEFFANQNDIWFSGSGNATGVILEDGYNDFEPKGSNGDYIYGFITDQNPPLDQTTIEVENNKMPTYTTTVGQFLPVDITYYSGQIAVPVDGNLRCQCFRT